MKISLRYLTPVSPCGYLADQQWRFEHVIVASMTAGEYEKRLETGWRHFGTLLFRPACPTCRACESLRVRVAEFQPSRSQRRNRKRNQGEIQCEFGPPRVDAERLALYDRFHDFQAKDKGWPRQLPRNAANYGESFVANPVPVEEWTYWLDGKLVGVGYVDCLPQSLSAIYFYHDPACLERGLGVWNILTLIEEAGRRGKPYLYLGYHVEGAASLTYKSAYRPQERFRPGQGWSLVEPEPPKTN